MKIEVTEKTITVVEPDSPVLLLADKPSLRTQTATRSFASSFENCIIMGTSILNHWGENQ